MRPSVLISGIGIIVLVGLSVAGGWKLGSSHWQKKYFSAEQTLAQITATGNAANADARATEKALQDQFTQETSAHADSENRLRERADVAERNYARILRERAQGSAIQTGATPAHSAEDLGAATESQRDREYAAIARAARDLAERAVHDAEALVSCQNLLRTERGQ